jgi:hypothetical protein
MLLQIFSGSYRPSAVFPPPPRRILPPTPQGSEGGRPFAGVGQGQAHGGGTIRIERILNLAWIPFVRKEMYNNFDPRQCPDLRDFGERAAHAEMGCREHHGSEQYPWACIADKICYKE